VQLDYKESEDQILATKEFRHPLHLVTRQARIWKKCFDNTACQFHKSIGAGCDMSHLHLLTCGFYQVRTDYTIINIAAVTQKRRISSLCVPRFRYRKEIAGNIGFGADFAGTFASTV
jgi:hypothetical protein